MKKQEWTEGLDHIDIEIVEKYIQQKEERQKINKIKKHRLRLGLTAACLVLAVVSIVVINSIYVPTWDNAKFTAEDIAAIFGDDDNLLGEPIKAYQTVIVPNEKYLNIDELPTDEYLGLYKYNKKGKLPSQDEFEDFVEEIMPRIAESTFTEIPEYTINLGLSSEYHLHVKNHDDYENFYFSVNQDQKYKYFSIKRKYNQNLFLKSGVVEIDTRLSDEEIIIKLEAIKNNLFEIFGVSFPDVKILREFDSYSVSGTKGISVYFYNKEANPLTTVLGIMPSDYICIDFERTEDTIEERKKYVLKGASISYRKCRVDASKIYTRYADAKKISLQEAEELLYKGYVFGGHSCYACMNAQDAVDFEGYDFVDITYIKSMWKYKPIIQIPFYTFYKKIGTAQNGNIIYAKTYVAAIKVSGYEEYFKSQIKNHK